jgi:hypothetical protein
VTARGWLLAALLALLVPASAQAQDTPTTGTGGQQTETGSTTPAPSEPAPSEPAPSEPAPGSPSIPSGAHVYSESVPTPAQPSTPSGGGSQQGGGGSSQDGSSSDSSTTPTEGTGQPSRRPARKPRRRAARRSADVAPLGDRPAATQRRPRVAVQTTNSPAGDSHSLLGLGLALLLITAVLVGAAGYQRGQARA